MVAEGNNEHAAAGIGGGGKEQRRNRKGVDKEFFKALRKIKTQISRFAGEILKLN